MNVNIQCPAGGAFINVTPGSGSGGTICVSGSVSGQEDDEHFFDGGYFVLVTVSPCGSGLNACPSTPNNPTNGILASISGSSWCATSVPIPNSSMAGVPMLLCAWVMFLSGSGLVVVSTANGVIFNACQGNPSAGNCCNSGPCSGSASTSPIHVPLAGELRAGPVLHVAVPDGNHTGLHTATPIANLKWSIRLAGSEFILSYCPTAGLSINGTAISATAESIEFEPFTATFGGGIFGATGEVVVTVA